MYKTKVILVHVKETSVLAAAYLNQISVEQVILSFDLSRFTEHQLFPNLFKIILGPFG